MAASWGRPLVCLCPPLPAMGGIQVAILTSVAWEPGPGQGSPPPLAPLRPFLSLCLSLSSLCPPTLCPFPPPSLALCPFSAFPTSGIVSHSVMCLSSLSFSVSIFLLLFPSPSLSPSGSSLCWHPWNKTEPQNPTSTRTHGAELFKP